MIHLRTLLCAPLLLALAAPGDGPSAAIKKGLAVIKADTALAHDTYLASDELEGRETGQPGCERAAKYLAGEFAKLGLEPFGDTVDGKRTFLQAYPLTATTLTAASGLTIEPAGGTKRFLQVCRWGRELRLRRSQECGVGSDRRRAARSPRRFVRASSRVAGGVGSRELHANERDAVRAPQGCEGGLRFVAFEGLSARRQRRVPAPGWSPRSAPPRRRG